MQLSGSTGDLVVGITEGPGPPKGKESPLALKRLGVPLRVFPSSFRDSHEIGLGRFSFLFLQYFRRLAALIAPGKKCHLRPLVAPH
jgi:hypothetical protein